MRREGLEARPQGRVGALKKPGKQAVGHRPKGVTFEGAAPRSDSRPTSQERKTRRRSTTETQDRSLPAPRSAPKEQNLPRPTSARPPSPLDLDQSARPRSAPDDTNLPAIVEADNRGEDEPDDTSLSEVDNPVEEDEVEEIGQIAERQVAKQRGSWWSNYVVRHNNLHKIVLWKQQLQARLGYEVMKKVKRGAVNRNAPLRKVIEARIEKKKAAELKSRRYVRGISHGEEAVLQTVSTLRGQWPAVPRVWQYCLDFIAFLLARTDVTQLAKCASVCHVWQQACLLRSDAVIPYANDAVFVNGKQTIAPKLETLHIRDGGVISLGKFLGFLSVAQNLTRMELCKCKILTDTSLGRVAGDCSSLQNLKVTEADRLCAPTLQSSTLKELTFSWCPFLETSYLSCSKLSEVSFDNCIEVGDSAPEHVLEVCPQLDAFSITGSDNLRDPQFFHENLKRLQLERCERLRNPRIITRSLEEIGFSGSFVLETPEIMSNELKRCKLYNMKQLQGGKLATDNLEGLSLSGGKMLQDSAFLNFIEECPSLADLYLSSMPKLRYVQLSSFKNITALAFENCQGLNDASMKLLFQEFNISLRRVSFEQCNLIVSPAFLFNDGLESFSIPIVKD